MSLDPVVAQEAIAAASLPTLVMCLAQVTGDRYWLTDRFRATRDTNLFADESGGLPDDVQAEVRSATMKLLVELDLGQREVPTDFNFDDFPSMMTVCLGEEVPPEYTRMLGEEMQLLDRNVHWQTSVAPLAAGDFRVLIIGAGFSGLCAAIKLDGLGIAWELLEKNADLGGPWFENSYPDAGVDTPNHFYSYSFAPNTRWTGYFSKRDEIWGYATAPQVTLRHQWQLGDVVLWNNFTTMHRRDAFPADQFRTMHRSQIKGKYVPTAAVHQETA